jgi:RES domain-containing protein
VSESLALAVLEQFVHVGDEGRHMKYVYARVDIPDSVKMEKIEVKNLPAGWNDAQILCVTMDIGTRWAVKAEMAILKVPSAIIPIECNFMLNPQHRDFNKIKIGEFQPFSFDPRMWKTESQIKR